MGGLWNGFTRSDIIEVCLNCIRFVPRRNIRTESDLYRFVERIRPSISAGALKIVQASSPIEEIREGQQLQDTYLLAFRCTKCEREFQLIADLYHGWGHWQ